MVLTRNSGATLDRALSSVRGFAEIIVCDGGSSDDTLEIAERHGATVILQDPRFLDAEGRLLDYAGVRHQVVRSATQPWIFHLDADEIATHELTRAIAELPPTSDVAAFRCRARHVVDGMTVQSAANYPMTFTRVFRRERVRGYRGPINERPEFDDDAIIADLDGEFRIPLPPLRVVLRKWARYQRIVALDARRDVGEPVRKLRDELRTVRWLAWRISKSRRSEPGPHMPVRYDASRVGFHLTMALNGFGSRIVGRVLDRRKNP